jgi:hypothetical protein
VPAGSGFSTDGVFRRQHDSPGSAILTGSPWRAGVDFDVVLTGPTWGCGVQATLVGSREVPGLNRILEANTVAAEDGVTDSSIETSSGAPVKGHAVRKNVADAHGCAALDTDRDPWAAVFAAAQENSHADGDITRSWCSPAPAAHRSNDSCRRCR